MILFNQNELFLLGEIIKKNFSSKYKDSVFGIVWSVLKPLLIMIILTIVFSTLFSGAVENYPVYLLSGRCIYDFFVGAVSASMNSLSMNKNIIERTAAPKHIFIIGGILSEFINFFITLIILFVVMIVTHAPIYFLLLPLTAVPIFSLLLMITGIGFVLAILRVYFTDIQHLWSVITMILVYSSAIFYPMDIIPEPYHSVLILNPLFWIIDQFRCFICTGTMPQLSNVINSLLLSLIILVFGIIIYKKYEKRVPMKF